MSNQPAAIRRADYNAPSHFVDTVDLRFELNDDGTIVSSRLQCRASDGEPGADLLLDGNELKLLEISVDGQPLPAARYTVDDQSLRIRDLPAQFELEIRTEIHPQRNTALEGLYKSGGMYCTQCEAEGFRRITYFPDRPDVMAVYTTTIVADPDSYPVLLSNGNRVDAGHLDDGRHWVRWHDPFPKPSYLFALVAGDLACHQDRFVTASGRDVLLQIFVEHHNTGKTDHAMAALKSAMAWDERTHGLEYDLDRYMIVAVDDFNMGAMENKGLNVFNTVCVLADPETSTDRDFETVEAVIAHEYFHNWTGNRVTCRDWFQLSLKEGLTVFREHQFCADQGSAEVKRIGEVRTLRAAQFPEDAGPLAHPVRPDSYIDISNFYTATVYNKGSEVIRMYHSLLGAEGYYRGMQLYFKRHDGQAVTCDDFLAAMADANDRDLTQFSRWYSQAGTPVLEVQDDYDATAQRYTLTVRQSCPATPGQAEKLPFHLPLVMGLLDQGGRSMALHLADSAASDAPLERLLEITSHEQQFVFEQVSERPVPSLLRGFSAPVRLRYDYTDQQLALLAAHDADGFTRWEAGQQLATKLMLAALDRAESPAQVANEHLLSALDGVLRRASEDPAFAAEALTLPSEAYIADQLAEVDVEAIHRVREACIRDIIAELGSDLETIYRENRGTDQAMDGASMGRRALACTALGLLARGDDVEDLLRDHYRNAANMTDRLCALGLLAHTDNDAAAAALADFHDRWRNDDLVVNKWFQVQAMSLREDTPELIAQLMEHPDFSLTNPNRVRSLIGAFAQGNPLRFHRPDGAGYRLLADTVLQLNAINPQVAARMLLPLTRWQRQIPSAREGMRRELERIGNAHKLSKDVFEVVSKGLQA